MTSTFLTLCVAPKAVDVDVGNTVAMWAANGMVSNLAVCAIDDLLEHGEDGRCRQFVGSEGSECSVGEILHRQPDDTLLTLASLRPRLPINAHEMTRQDWRQYFRREVEAGQSIQKIWHRDETLVKITVSIAREGMSQEAFSSWWHGHLIPDRRAIKLPNTYVSIEEEDSVAVCVFSAVCVGAGWTLSNGRLLRSTIENENREGRFREVRLVRPEMRIVMSRDLKDRFEAVTADGFPDVSPWPSPSDIDTVRLEPDYVPPESLVKELRRACGFVAEDRHFGNRLDLSNWRRARSVTRLYFRRLHLSSDSALLDWEQSLWNDGTGAIQHVADEDGTGGLIVDDPEVAKNMFDHYMQDIEEAYEAIEWIREAHWDDFDFDEAVRSLRKAGFSELSLGMQYHRSEWPNCWSTLRRCCFALLDGSEFPEGIDELALQAYSPGTERPVWYDPSIVAPHSSADSSDAFEFDEELASKLGVSSLPPIDALIWKRADCLIHGDRDPFRPGEEGDGEHGRGQPHGEVADNSSRRTDGWNRWNAQFEDTLMKQLACGLGNAVEYAYRKLAENLEPPDDDNSEVLHSLTRFRTTQIVSLPVIVGLPIVAVVLALVGWLFSGGKLLPAVVIALAWVIAAGVASSSSWKLVDVTRQYAYATSDRWRWAITVRHYAVEFTRLHGVARAFADHQAVVRTMLHEPFPRGARPRVQATPEQAMPDLRPNSLVVATASVDDAGWLRERSGRLPKRVHQGWINSAYEAVEATWKEAFRRSIGEPDFRDPDDDYTAPGATPYRASGTRAKLPGAREHFRAAVVDDVALRIEARVRTVMEHLGSSHSQEVESLGPVSVERYPVINGTARAFLQFDDARVDDDDPRNVFDPRMLRDGVGPVSVSQESSIGLDGSYEKLERWRSDGAVTAFGSMRMLVSDSFPPGDLRGVVEPRTIDH